MSREEVYDKQIQPLMSQIIDICLENQIAFIADFCITDDEDAEGRSVMSAAIPPDSGDKRHTMYRVIIDCLTSGSDFKERFQESQEARKATIN